MTRVRKRYRKKLKDSPRGVRKLNTFVFLRGREKELCKGYRLTGSIERIHAYR